MSLQKNMHHILLVMITATYFFSHTHISCYFCCMLMLRHTKSQIICNALLQSVNHRLVCYFSYKTSMAEEQESLNMIHSRLGMILPSYLVTERCVTSRKTAAKETTRTPKRGRVAEKPWKRCWMLV